MNPCLKYSEFRPTAFDPKGSFLDDSRQEWIVAPVSQTRDSEPLELSNFRVVLADIGGEGANERTCDACKGIGTDETSVPVCARCGNRCFEQTYPCIEAQTEPRVAAACEACNSDGVVTDVEVHRFGHWGRGWFEIILCRPESAAADKCAEWERTLADYPVADDDDYGTLEWETASAYWEQMSVRERVELCQRFGCSVFGARHDSIPRDDDGGRLFDWLRTP